MAIKQYLTELPILASLGASNTLYLYLAVSEASISAALFKEDENRKKRPIFFVNKYLSETETWYTGLEQAALALHVIPPKYVIFGGCSKLLYGFLFWLWSSMEEKFV